MGPFLAVSYGLAHQSPQWLPKCQYISPTFSRGHGLWNW